MLIKKNGEILNVTKGAYKALFKDNGWKVTKEKPSNKNNAYMTPQPNKKEPKGEQESTEVPFGNLLNEESEDELEDYEIILEEMTVKELIEYAEENDIDLEGKTRKDDIISAIRKELEEE